MKKMPLIDAFFSHKLFQSYRFAVVVSMLLHILVLGFLSWGRSSEDELRIVPPRSIKASVVEVVQPKPSPPKPVVDSSAQKARELAAKKRREEARRQAEIKKQKLLALKKKQAAQAAQAAKEEAAKEKARKEEAVRKEREQQQRLAEERRKKKQQEELHRRLEQERIAQEQAQAAAAEQAEKNQSRVAYYEQLLGNLITDKWSRPASARNNMLAVVQITLSPFGDLLKVRLTEKSGSEEFDRSAVNAVIKAAPFPELRELDRKLFDQHFRQFEFAFRPEDLVR